MLNCDCNVEFDEPKKKSLRNLLPNLDALKGGPLCPEIVLLSDESGHISNADGSIGFRFHTYNELKDYLACLINREPDAFDRLDAFLADQINIEPEKPIVICRDCDCKIKNPTAMEIALEGHETWERCLAAIKKRAIKRMKKSCNLI